MSILRKIPQDGTFDQPAPLRWLKGCIKVRSYDLSSATDRFPLKFQRTVIECLFNKVVAWVGKVSTTSVPACTGRAPIPPFALTDRSYPNTKIAERKTMYSESRHPIPKIESDYLNQFLMKEQSFPLFIHSCVQVKLSF